MINEKTALISGARGQDSAWLSRLLLSKGWKVIAFERHTQSPDYTNIKELFDNPNFILEKGDVTDLSSVSRLVERYSVQHFYHLAGNSFVGCSWDEPIAVFNANAIGTLNCLEAVRTLSPKTKFLFASSSEVVGNSEDRIQSIETKPSPRSPYAISKLSGEYMCDVYSQSYGLHCIYTRCYNHESIFRGKEFVTRKITDYIGRTFNIVEKYVLKNNLSISTEEAYLQCLKLGIIKTLELGNLGSERDWLDSRNCVEAMFLALSSEEKNNFVIASGKMHSIRDLLKYAFGRIGIEDWTPFIFSGNRFSRPNDVVTLCGDYSKAKSLLNWEPTISFEQMISEMVDNDIEINRKT